MLGRVVVENGVKKIVPLTADCGSGNPCGAIIIVYQRTVPNGYLPLGAQYDITQFPVLYSILGTDTIPTASALGLPTLTTGQYVIKATSGINENQADNVLSALSPVNAVTSGDMHAVTSNAVFNAMSYSTEEVFTGKYWIDGKPIYRKCFYYATPPTQNTVLVTNVDKCIDCGGTQLWGNVYFEFPYIEGAGSSRIRLSPLVNQNVHNLYIDLENLDSNVSKCNWWFEYTKTTD